MLALVPLNAGGQPSRTTYTVKVEGEYNGFKIESGYPIRPSFADLENIQTMRFGSCARLTLLNL
jgi:hypothetical protein